MSMKYKKFSKGTLLFSKFAVVSVFAGFSSLFFTLSVHADTSASNSTSPVSLSQSIQITSTSVDDREDFIVEPGKVEVHANPGDSVTEYISVTSRIKNSTEFAVSAEDFVGSQSESNPVILLGDQKSPYSLKDWLVPATNDFTLHFGDQATLPITINVPKDASPGGYYAAVIISNAPQVTADSSSTAGTAQIVSRIGVLFFVRVNGDITSSGQLSDFRINPSQAVYSSVPNDFQILFNDTGSIYLAPYGEIRVDNFFGKEIADLPVDAYFALPDSLRYRDIIWNDNNFRIGRYTATVNLNRSYGGVVDTKTIVFWILPWKIITAVVVGLIVVVGIIYFFLSRFEFRRKR
jgi:hypothetical protein